MKPDRLLEVFEMRCRKVYVAGTAKQYTWAVRDVMKLAAERLGWASSVVDLFKDADLLGALLMTTDRAGGGPEIAGWTVPARRNGIHAAARLLAPELRAEGIADPEGVVQEGLRLHAERIGMTYRLPKSLHRNRGGITPDAASVRAVFAAAGAAPGWVGVRDMAIFKLMFFTGGRVNAARTLDGTCIWREPDGGGRMLVHAKHAKDSGEFLIPAVVMRLVDEYAAGFNQWAALRGIPVRIGVGVDRQLWRGTTGRPLSYSTILKQLTFACETAGVERLTPDAFRRAFATLGTEHVPRPIVSTAGGWAGSRLMDEHYVHRPFEVAKRKVAQATCRRSEDLNVAPAPTPEPMYVSGQ